MDSSIPVSDAPELRLPSGRRPGALPLTGRIGLGIVLVLLVAAVAGPSVTADPYAQDLARSLEGPSREHWLGTDQLGRDLVARLVLGARFSLAIGLGATLFGLAVGGAAGVLGAYLGGLVDAVVLRAADLLLTFPGILIALMVVAVTGTGLANVVVAVGLRGVPVFARVARASTLVAREHDSVMAARALGASTGRLLARHVAPALMNSLVVLGALQVATAILVGSTLSFLGLGVPPETPEWGAMLNGGRRYMLQQGQLVVYPGLAIMLTILGINLLGDGLRAALDPRRTRGRLLE
jgi:ABC-type dipeptide/oligopeptide/nickel transport system permease subunit